ncbi:MAG TPA: DNA primase [Acidimicrobiales bacterium]|jgi:DNA primase|nr:DNA primase [Acidimicrobiales bacterium]
MSVAPEEIAQVRAATDIVALLGEHVALRKTGQRWTGLCPFHEEKTPSFSVNAEEGLYYCFGCQARGDAITFVRETQHLDFIDALRQLAERAGIQLHEDRDAGSGGWRDKSVLYDAVERAVAWYHERLLSAPDAGRARDYLRSRGYDADTVREFRLGWAPDDWDQLVRALKLPTEVVSTAGLGFVNKGGRLQDALRARVLFPILDPGGRPIAIGGRILPASGDGTPAPGRVEPKYKNTQETPIYQKRKTLYGLNWAKQDVVATSEIVVCEGYTDVIAFFSAGVRRAVATCGTALAEDHFRVMRNFAKRIVLAYDADAAGQNAAASVYQWERTHEVEVSVCRLPHGADPADLARTDPGALAKSVVDAVPFLQFRLDAALAGADVSTPEGRARAAERALAVIVEHPSDLVRDQYVMQVADRCRLDPTLLRDGVARQLRTGTARPLPRPRRNGAAPQVGGDRAGLEALRLALHAPETTLPRLSTVLFVDEVQRVAYEAIASGGSHTEVIDAVQAEGEDDVAALLNRLLVEEPQQVPSGTDAVTSVVAQLVRHATRRVLTERETAVRSGELAARDVVDEISVAKELLSHLEGPGGTDAERELVEWLESEEGTRVPG